jgi:HSP20 family protein
MMSMRRAMDRLMDSTFGDDWDSGTTEWSLPLDVIENEDDFVVKATVPGVKPEDLEVTYNNGALTIKGEVKAEEEKKEGKYHLRERRYGTFVRTVALPPDVKPDNINAEYHDGVLTLTLPKAEEVKPKRISIKGIQNKLIEGKAAK